MFTFSFKWIIYDKLKFFFFNFQNEGNNINIWIVTLFIKKNIKILLNLKIICIKLTYLVELFVNFKWYHRNYIIYTLIFYLPNNDYIFPRIYSGTQVLIFVFAFYYYLYYYCIFLRFLDINQLYHLNTSNVLVKTPLLKFF